MTYAEKSMSQNYGFTLFLQHFYMTTNPLKIATIRIHGILKVSLTTGKMQIKHDSLFM